jgi:hypothetical protein
MHEWNVWQLNINVMFGQRPPMTPNKSMPLSLIAIFVLVSFGFPLLHKDLLWNIEVFLEIHFQGCWFQAMTLKNKKFLNLFKIMH